MALLLCLLIVIAGCPSSSETPERPATTTEGGAGDEQGSSPPLQLADQTLTKLPEPRLDLGFPLMKALSLRQSQRSFAPKMLSAQLMSDLLWATAGVNRPSSGKRTAPSAHNRQEIDLYVALSDGLALYQPQEHALKRVLTEDLRAMTGTQGFVATAPVNLVFVVDLDRMRGRSDEERRVIAAADVGYMSQNTYLYAAAAGLATVVRGSVEQERLGQAMRLGPRQEVVLAHTVGYPSE